jgi:hypothetical protein
MPTDTFTTRLFPPLDATIEAALGASIERFGVIVPVVEDQHGNTLDGHHRKRIADELGKPYEIQTVHVRDLDEACAVARTLNADRRHLTIEQRREVVAVLRQDGHSERAIAGALNVPKTTIHRDVEQLVQADQLKPPEIIKGLDGKSRKAERKAGAVASVNANLQRTLQRIDDESRPAKHAPGEPWLSRNWQHREDAEAGALHAEMLDAVRGEAGSLHAEMLEAVRGDFYPMKAADMPEGVRLSRVQGLMHGLFPSGHGVHVREFVRRLTEPDVTDSLNPRERAYLFAAVEFAEDVVKFNADEARRILSSSSR